MKLRSRGRGRGYSLIRGLVESALRVLYVGDWPRRLWDLIPWSSRVREVRQTLVVPGFENPTCRIALVSDLHLGPTTPRTLIDRVFEIIRSSEPDVVLLGGDYVFLDATPQVLSELTELVRSLNAPTKLAVMGNHDLWTEDQLIVNALEDAGVMVLVNQAVHLPRPWNDVAVIGLDEPWTGTCDPGAAFTNVDGARFRIVLCHGPDGLLRASGQEFELYLCGHTHGGHLATPWGPLVLPDGELCRRFPAGFGRFNSAQVFVSRGVGGVEVPVRTFAPPDVLILDLVRDQPGRHFGASGLDAG